MDWPDPSRGAVAIGRVNSCLLYALQCLLTNKCLYPSTHNPLQQRIAQCAPDNAAARPDRVACSLFIQAGIDLDEIQRHQRACLGHALGYEVSLSQR